MLRHMRTATNALTVNAVTLLTLVLAGSAAGAMPLSAVPSTTRHDPHHLVSARRHRQLFGITPRMMTEASRVARCEEGGNWHFAGTTFDGGIGWTLANWAHFRKPTWPRYMHSASPHMQANALFRFVWHFGIALPDQNGACAGY